MKRTRLVGAMLAVGLLGGAPAGAELKAGSTLDQSNWEEAKDLLAPEILARQVSRADRREPGARGQVRAGA